MKSFKSLFTKDDELFWGVIRDSLPRQDYELVWLDAMDEFKKHDKPSAAKKEANLIGLKALKELGINWRQSLEKKERPTNKPFKPTAPREGKTASGTRSSGKPSKILQMSKR